MRRTRWALLLGAAAAPIAGLGLLKFEDKVLRWGRPLTKREPFEHDGIVGGPGPALRVVWLGDSMVTGAGATSAAASLPRLVAEGLARPVEVVVRAVSGSKVHDVAEGQVPQLADAEPDVVIVSIGTNDSIYRTSRTAFRADHQRIVDALPPNVPTVFLGCLDMGAVPRYLQPLRAFTGWFARGLDDEARPTVEAAGERVAFVDIRRAVGPAMRRDRTLFSEDQFHPSDHGYRALADAVVTALVPLLTPTPAAGALAP